MGLRASTRLIFVGGNYSVDGAPMQLPQITIHITVKYFFITFDYIFSSIYLQTYTSLLQ
jgi:hypothetical protein